MLKCACHGQYKPYTHPHNTNHLEKAEVVNTDNNQPAAEVTGERAEDMLLRDIPVHSLLISADPGGPRLPSSSSSSHPHSHTQDILVLLAAVSSCSPTGKECK